VATVTERAIPTLRRVRGDRDRLVEILRALDVDTLGELLRRAGAALRRDDQHQWFEVPNEDGAGQAVADGYPRGGEGGRGRQVNADGTPTSAVTSVVLTAAGGDGDEADNWPEPADPIVATVRRICDGMATTRRTLEAVDRLRRYVLASGDARRGRQSSLQGPCRCCYRDVLGTARDRLRTGYCQACYRAWLDAGRPGADAQEPGDRRGVWERERRRWLEQHGRLAG
jgi:hypothetical protein